MHVQEWSAANEILDDPVALARRYDRDGCLLIRDAIPIEDLAEVIAHTAAVFQRWGVGEVSAPAPGEPPALRWNGQPLEADDEEELDSARTLDPRCPEYDRLHTALRRLVDHVCGQPMDIWDNGNIRASLPDDPAFTTPPHRDGFALSPGGDYRRVWVALTDIPFGDNGLGVALGSHRMPGPLPYRPLPEYRTRPSRFWPTKEGRPVGGLGPEVVDEWHSAHMRPGDAIIFTKRVIHRGLPATSDRIRAALAIHMSAPGTRRPPAGYTSDYQRVRQIRAFAEPLGLTNKDVMRVRADLMFTGIEVSEATVREALAGQYAGWREEASWDS